MSKVAVLTAGGDCPGLNAVIRAVTRCVHNAGGSTLGMLSGYEGLAEGRFIELGLNQVSGILPLGGTVLKTSAFNPAREPDGVQRCRATMEAQGIDAVIAIGGDHTMRVTRQLAEEFDMPVVGVPKTIDNDIVGTDYTFGFDTAVQIATEAIDRLHSTAESHDRVMIVEVMGADAGWIAMHAGMAGGGDVILIPELPMTVAEIADKIRTRQARGKSFSIVVCAEGASLRENEQDQGHRVMLEGSSGPYSFRRLGGIGMALGQRLEQILAVETRVTVLGHVQRGGSPTATDRILGTRYGTHAAHLALTQQWGRMVVFTGNRFGDIPLSEVEGTKTVDPESLAVMRQFMG